MQLETRMNAVLYKANFRIHVFVSLATTESSVEMMRHNAYYIY